MDNQHFRLWRLDEIAKVNGTEKELMIVKKRGVLFADYLIDSWGYRVAEDGKVYLESFDQNNPRFLANSLTEFFECMADDPDNVLY